MDHDTKFDAVPIDSVRNYWNSRPCNIRHSQREVGTCEYFNEVEARKYYVEPHIPAFADFAAWKGKKVLEIGCGIGTDTINFARHGAQVTTVDLSDQSMALAKQRAEVFGLSDRIRFCPGNAEELTSFVPVEKYDLIYSFGVIHHTPHPDRVYQQLTNYAGEGTTLKVMNYYRFAWKVYWIVMRYGKGQFWKTKDLVARYSEAQTGCPVTYTYGAREMSKLLATFGFETTETLVDHIFPYVIKDYKEYRYKKVWYFRYMPQALFRMLERRFGWHLCVTAKYSAAAAAKASTAPARKAA